MLPNPNPNPSPAPTPNPISRGEERTRIDDERFQLTSNSLANFSLGGEEKHI